MNRYLAAALTLILLNRRTRGTVRCGIQSWNGYFLNSQPSYFTVDRTGTVKRRSGGLPRPAYLTLPPFTRCAT